MTPNKPFDAACFSAREFRLNWEWRRAIGCRTSCRLVQRLRLFGRREFGITDGLRGASAVWHGRRRLHRPWREKVTRSGPLEKRPRRPRPRPLTFTGNTILGAWLNVELGCWLLRQLVYNVINRALSLASALNSSVFLTVKLTCRSD